MKLLNRICIRNLKLNKKRTASTIVGIILSVALICAVSSMISSFQKTLVENAINETGYWHLKMYDVREDKEKELDANRDIRKSYTTYEIGYSVLENSQNEYKPYLRVVSMDNETFDYMHFNLIKGRFPENDNEIVISKHIIGNANVNMNIGDTLNLKIGERKSNAEPIANQETPYQLNNEELINLNEKAFTVVGIIERPGYVFESYSCPGYTVITTNLISAKKDKYIILENPKSYKEAFCKILENNEYEKIRQYSDEIKLDYKLNNELLRWEVFAFNDSTVNMLFTMCGILIFIIVFTSVFCIRNSFAIATTEKIKMYGMLASVGATKKQIRKSVIFEAMALGVIGIPFGIFAGIFATFVLFKIVNLLIGDILLAHVDGIILSINPASILISILLGIVTIYLSAISSARKASKVSPIESLKGTGQIKLNSKKLQTPKIINNVFKTDGILAYKNLKRSKKKYRTTVISITVSIFLFITINAITTNMFTQATTYYKDYDYDIEVYIPYDTSKDTVNSIYNMNNTEEFFNVFGVKSSIFKITDKSKITYPDSMTLISDDAGNEEEYLSIEIVGLDDETFKKYAKKIGENYDDVKKGGILCDYFLRYDENAGTKQVRTYNYKKDDFLIGYLESENSKEEKSIQISAITETNPYGLEDVYMSGGFLVLNVDYHKEFDFYKEKIYIKSGNPDTLETEINKLGDNIGVQNISKSVKKQRSMILVMNIFIYGFITVITLIGVTNIFNTITSNIELRQREFASLKSIGMTKKEFNRMINLETIFYSCKSLIYGIIFGLIGTFAVYKAASINIDKGMYIPVWPILISIVSVFVLVFVIMKYSISKVNKQNIIETIRNENI